MSLKKRIQIILLFLVLVPLLLLLLQSYRTSRSTLQQQIREGSLQIAQLEAKEMDLIFDPPRYIVQGLVRALEAKPHLDADGVRDLLRSTLIQTPGIFGVAVGFEPEATPLGRFCHYYYRPDGEVKERSMLDLDNDYTRRVWYRLPIDTEKEGWTGAYFDKGGGETPMITYTAPIRFDGRVVGVAEVDLDLAGLVKALQAIKPGGDGTVFLVNRAGQVLAHPKFRSMAEMDVEAELVAFADLMKRTGVDCVELKDPISHIDSWVVETPVPSLSAVHGGHDWSLIVSWPLNSRLAPLGGLRRQILVLYLFLGGASFLFLNRSFDRIVTRPLARLAERARQYARGDFTPPPPLNYDTLELQELNRALEKLGKSLAASRKPGPGGEEDKP